MKRIASLGCLLFATAMSAIAGDSATLMTQAKLDADMGRRAEAARAFEAVAGDQMAPPSLRAEALVRLGLVRRDSGDEKGEYEAFAALWKDYRHDPRAVAELLEALGAALPGQDRWNEIWQRIAVDIDTRKAIARIEWPEVGVSDGRAPLAAASPRPQAISLDFKDGDLQDVFRLFADVTGLNVVVHPGVQGRVTFQCKSMPWDDALERILAPNGLAFTLNGSVLEIGRPKDLPAARRFQGKAIDFDFKARPLVDALQDIAARADRRVSAAPGVAGNVTFKLVGVPWDQAFDLLARLNGLDWHDDGGTIRVGLPDERR